MQNMFFLYDCWRFLSPPRISRLADVMEGLSLREVELFSQKTFFFNFHTIFFSHQCVKELRLVDLKKKTVSGKLSE